MTAVDDAPTGGAAQLAGRYNDTDVGNAERLVARHGDTLRYCHLWASWLAWDGTRWKIDDTGAAKRLAQETIRAMLGEAIELEGDQRKRLIKHALSSEQASRIRGMLDMAQAREGIPVTADDLDADPWALNVQNGTLELRRPRLRPHTREDLITKLAPVTYDADADAPRWRRFLSEIFDQDDDLIGFVQRAAGYSLTGDTSEQVFFLLHGSGENGKSTFLETLRDVLGDYAQQAPADTFLERRYQGIPNDIARLKGARFVTAIETGDSRRLDETLVKRMTGGDTITARFMRSEFFEFQPLFKVWLATNHRPQIRGTDHAIWRRIRLIPFERTFSPADRDTDLSATLRKELPGILNWALEGLRDWLYGDTLEPPTAVAAATADYRQQQDVLGAFLAEHTVDDATGRAFSGELYKRYRAWADTAGERHETQTAFGLRLRERGYESGKSHGRSLWKGLRLKDDEDLFTAAE